MADRRPQAEIPTSSNQQVLLSFGMLQGFPSSSTAPNFISTRSTGLESFKDHHEVYDLAELERALILNQPGGDQEQDHSGLAERQGFGIRPPTLTIFPSWPMQFEASPKATASQSVESTDTGSAQYKGDPQVEIASANTVQVQKTQQLSDMAGNSTRTETSNEMDRNSKPETNRRGPTSSSEHEASKTLLDAKTLRRLAQNREAARKSRLRKKAYVQQLESSRIKLNQIEQDLQRARAQGLLIGGTALLNDQGYLGAGGLINVPLTSGAAMFDMEYSRWLEEQHRHMGDLRAALQAHLSDNDLRLLLDNCLSHYDEVYRLKSIAAKTDVFHLVSGMWKTPAERCFMWMGGFRPSELLKILIPQLEPLTEQQFLGICNLQQSSQQAEDALSQGMEALQQSLSETIAAGSLSMPSNVANYMGQMAIAMGKLANLESLVRQADSLRQQTLHQLHRLLTIRQAARCLLAIGEYFTRLRALSSLWSARPRERLMVDGSCSPATTTPSHDNYFSTS